MIHNKIIIGALTGWQHPDRRDRCEKTWMADTAKLGTDAVFLSGNPDVQRPQRYGPLLVLPCPNEYPALPQRTRWFCRWALDLPTETWDFLFKCDDDTYVSAARLISYDTAGRDYIGGEWRPGVGYGSGGGGYLLSRRAVEIVAEKLTHSTGAEDLLVGQVLREAGISFHCDNRFVAFGSDQHRPRRDNDLITVHGVEAGPFMAAHQDTGSPSWYEGSGCSS